MSKGNTTLDLLLSIAMVTVIGIGFIVGFQAFSDLNDDLQGDDTISSVAKATSQNSVDQFPSWGDNAVVVFMVLMWMLIIFSSFLIDTHPVFFMVTVILLIFVFVVAMILSNTYTELTDDPEISSFTASFPKTTWIMEHLLLIAIVMGLSGATALFARQS